MKTDHWENSTMPQTQAVRGAFGPFVAFCCAASGGAVLIVILAQTLFDVPVITQSLWLG